MEEFTVRPGEALDLSARGIAAVRQNIRVIILTTMYSVPLDRGFAHVASALDSPSPAVTARLVGELTAAIEKYEPRVKVENITFDPAENSPAALAAGRFCPRVRFRLRERVQI